MPEKIVLLSITEEEKEKIEREYFLACKSSIDDEEVAAVEAFAKKAKDHYKHILVHRGCYNIVKKSASEKGTKEWI